MTDDLDPICWVDVEVDSAEDIGAPDAGDEVELGLDFAGGGGSDLGSANAIWEALHELLDLLRIWMGDTAALVRHAALTSLLLLVRGVPAVGGIAALYEVGTGISVQRLIVTHPTRIALAFLFAGPASGKIMKVLVRESRRHQDRKARLTHQAVADYSERIGREQMRHIALGRSLPSQTDLAALPRTREVLEETALSLRGDRYFGSIILAQHNGPVRIVAAAGDAEPSLSEGIVLPRELVFSGRTPYAALVAGLGLHHAQVHFLTGSEHWDLLFVTGGTLSDKATLQLCLTVTRILTDACVAAGIIVSPRDRPAQDRSSERVRSTKGEA